MLWHLGRAGVPMEVMGLMLGDFVDDYTVKVVDVFAMPQSGTGVSVEAVDPVYQTKMSEMLNQVGRLDHNLSRISQPYCRVIYSNFLELTKLSLMLYVLFIPNH